MNSMQITFVFVYAYVCLICTSLCQEQLISWRSKLKNEKRCLALTRLMRIFVFHREFLHSSDVQVTPSSTLTSWQLRYTQLFYRKSLGQTAGVENEASVLLFGYIVIMLIIISFKNFVDVCRLYRNAFQLKVY